MHVCACVRACVRVCDGCIHGLHNCMTSTSNHLVMLTCSPLQGVSAVNQILLPSITAIHTHAVIEGFIISHGRIYAISSQ